MLDASERRPVCNEPDRSSDFAPRESGPAARPAGLSSRESLSAKHKQEFVDMTGVCPLARACGLRVSDRSSSPRAYREGLVAFKVSDRVLRWAFERLEPPAGKLARAGS
jgi:hypothetical protein